MTDREGLKSMISSGHYKGMGRSSFLGEYSKAHVQSPEIFYEDYYPGQERLFLKRNGMEFPKVGRGWGKNSRGKNKGLRYISATPCFYW
jgi:hypothetical protein